MDLDEELLFKTRAQLALWSGVVGGTPWGAEKGCPRIYMTEFGEEPTAYFKFIDFPTGHDVNVLGGAWLEVYVSKDGRNPDEVRAMTREMIQQYRLEQLALGFLNIGEPGMASAVTQLYRDRLTREDEDRAWHYILNHRPDDARRVLGL